MENAQTNNSAACGQSRSTVRLERMVREAGWSGIYTQWVSPTERESMTVPVTPQQVLRFAAIVAAAEREECAKTCESIQAKTDKWGPMAGYCAEQIRMRSNVQIQGAEPLAAKAPSGMPG